MVRIWRKIKCQLLSKKLGEEGCNGPEIHFSCKSEATIFIDEKQ